MSVSFWYVLLNIIAILINCTNDIDVHSNGTMTFITAESRLLWSGSSDRTIRVWELNTGRCVGVLNGASGGHTEAVSCLEFIPAPLLIPGGPPG